MNDAVPDDPREAQVAAQKHRYRHVPGARLVFDGAGRGLRSPEERLREIQTLPRAPSADQQLATGKRRMRAAWP